MEVVRACRAGHTIGDTLGSLTPRRPASGREAAVSRRSGGPSLTRKRARYNDALAEADVEE